MFVAWFSGFLRQNHDYLNAFGIVLASLMLSMELYAYIGLNTKFLKELSNQSLVQYRTSLLPGRCTVRKTQRFFGLTIHLLGYAIIVGVLAYGEHSHKTWNFVDNILKNSTRPQLMSLGAQ